MPINFRSNGLHTSDIMGGKHNVKIWLCLKALEPKDDTPLMECAKHILCIILKYEQV